MMDLSLLPRETVEATQAPTTWPPTIWRLVVDEVARSGPANMAIDQAIAEACAAGESLPTLRFYRWQPPAVSLGRHQAAEDVDLARIAALGYELVWADRRAPNLFGVALVPDTFGWPGLRPPAALAHFLTTGPSLSFGRADESFVVYDQPLTMIFRNTGGLSAEQMRAAFDTPAR